MSKVLSVQISGLLMPMGFPLMSFVGLMVLSIIIPSIYALAVVGLSYWLFFFLAFWYKYKLNARFYRQPEIILLLLFCIYALISLLWSPWGNNYSLLVKEFIRIMCVIGLVMLFGFISKDAGLLQVDLFYIFVVSVCGVFLLSYYAFYLISHFEERWLAKLYILKQLLVVGDGSLGHSTLVAWQYAISTLLIIPRLLHSIGKNRVIYFVAFLVSLSIVILAQSRATYLGLLAGAWCFGLLRGGRVYSDLILMIILLLSVFFAIYFLFDVASVNSLINRADSGRFYIYANALEEIKQAPIFGHGFATVASNLTEKGQTVAHYHSMYLNILFFGGFVGLFLFMSMVCVFLLRALRVQGCEGWYSVVIMSLVIFIVDGFHVLALPHAVLSMNIMAIIIVVSLRMQQE